MRRTQFFFKSNKKAPNKCTRGPRRPRCRNVWNCHEGRKKKKNGTRRTEQTKTEREQIVPPTTTAGEQSSSH